MEQISVRTGARTQLLDITKEIQKAVDNYAYKSGTVTVFIPHTTAAVTINENADPDVQRDMLMEINKVIPFEDGYRHFEGNSSAHIKASLFGFSETIIVEDGRLRLGVWQGVYFCEFDGPRNRKIWIKFS